MVQRDSSQFDGIDCSSIGPELSFQSPMVSQISYSISSRASDTLFFLPWNFMCVVHRHTCWQGKNSQFTYNKNKSQKRTLNNSVITGDDYTDIFPTLWEALNTAVSSSCRDIYCFILAIYFSLIFVKMIHMDISEIYMMLVLYYFTCVLCAFRPRFIHGVYGSVCSQFYMRFCSENLACCVDESGFMILLLLTYRASVILYPISLQIYVRTYYGFYYIP